MGSSIDTGETWVEVVGRKGRASTANTLNRNTGTGDDGHNSYFSGERKNIAVERIRRRKARCTPWEEVAKALSTGIGRKVTLNPVGSDRAVLVCANEEGRDHIHKEGYEMRNNLIYRIHLWNPNFHWMEQRWGGLHCWIKMEGLPRNMWSPYAFKMIGERFGGFEEVEAGTLHRQRLEGAILKVRGNKYDFFPEVITVLC
ncbi:hypothetical protein Scep_019877 [Stephania cephalantha]|uniref:DUF4283 domain-containing protein n=1 Tax=Stephania cephalantha TaxID=152367 RepID=A0AAP0NML0_9MAGN